MGQSPFANPFGIFLTHSNRNPGVLSHVLWVLFWMRSRAPNNSNPGEYLCIPHVAFLYDGFSFVSVASFLFYVHGSVGATARRLGLPAEEDFWSRGISACAICDGAAPIFRDVELGVVGGGDSAVEEAVYLTKFSPKVCTCSVCLSVSFFFNIWYIFFLTYIFFCMHVS